jgi:hypothetical protein
MASIRLESITKTFGPVTALRNVSFEVVTVEVVPVVKIAVRRERVRQRVRGLMDEIIVERTEHERLRFLVMRAWRPLRGAPIVRPGFGIREEKATAPVGAGMMRPEGGATMVAIVGGTDRLAELRGMRFHYVEWGQRDAPPVVLLHGLTGHARIWDHTAARLADRFHLFALDQRTPAWRGPPGRHG